MSLGAVDVEQLRERVSAVLDALLREQGSVIESVSTDLAPVLDPIRHLLLGGKRLRPAFCYWGWRGAGGDDGDAILSVAAAVELFHVAALIHDDVMDASDTRRGQPAVHRRFEELHRSRGWNGSSPDFGLAGAILSGDLCLSWSDELFASTDLPPDRITAGRRIFDRMKTELMCGQYLDMLGQAMGSTDVERARQVIFFKTSKYSIQQPLVLGATLAGGGPALMAAFEAYGASLGEAFQLRDDVLGVFGDPGTTGKPAGDDLREGKRTVLVAMTLQRCSAAEAAALTQGLGDSDLDESGVARLRDIIAGSGAVEAVEALVEEQSTRALQALAVVPSPAREVLEALVAAATTRTR